jgi:two-component system nitrogen regulation response regulator GlnG
VQRGTFREDLFHRLNVIHIETPPLRDRAEDIPSLLNHYLTRAAQELGVASKHLTTDAEAVLKSFDWPGNVRQLVNACRRLTVTAPGNEICREDIPDDLGGQRSDAAGTEWLMGLARWAERQLDNDAAPPLLETAQPEFERALIRAALARANGRRQDAARLLGMGRNTLTRKIRELGIDV